MHPEVLQYAQIKGGCANSHSRSRSPAVVLQLQQTVPNFACTQCMGCSCSSQGTLGCRGFVSTDISELISA